MAITDHQAWVSANPAEYDDTTIDAPYKKLNFKNGAADGYVKTLGEDINYPWARFPTEAGASATTYYSDYYYQNTGLRACYLGGGFYGGTYQTLPWDIVGWHSGSGHLGSAKNANNNGYIGFEICEDGLSDSVYFGKVYQEAVELCAYLCKQYNLDPTADGVIIGHYEGYARGIASNHGDPKNWFPKHGKSMDTFRAAVKALLAPPAPAPIPTPSPASGEFKVGDIVEFTGNTHYTSASAKSGVRCKPGKAKVTAVYPKGTHPYHLIRESGGGSTVYGWVDAADITGAKAPTPAPAPAPVATIKVGSKVKVKSGARTYTGGGLASFVYKTVYDVQQIKGDRVVIGLKGQVTAAVKLADLILQ